MTSDFTYGGKALLIEQTPMLPVTKIMTEACWTSKYTLNRNEFIGFTSQTALGKKLYAIKLNYYASDGVGLAEFYDTTFRDTDDQSVAYLQDPPTGWAVVDDCGDFPCTAPYNVILSFKGTKFEANKPSWKTEDFQIIADNDGFAPYIEGCTRYADMNAYICKEENLG